MASKISRWATTAPPRPHNLPVIGLSFLPAIRASRETVRPQKTPEAASNRAPHRLQRQMVFDLFQMHHVGILVMQVEEVDLMGEKAPVEAALFHDHDMKAIGVRVHDARAHAAAGALAAHDQAVDPHAGQVRDYGSAEKAARPLLVDNEISRLRLEGLVYFVIVLLRFAAAPVRRMHVRRLDLPPRLSSLLYSP